MGADITANAIIGVKLPKPPFEEVKVRSCHCTADPSSGDFCFLCGKKTWKSERRPLGGYSDELDTWGEFVVARGGDGEASVYFMGIHYTETEDCMCPSEAMAVSTLPDEIDIPELTRKLKEILEPVGLWRGTRVGLWVFGYTTC